MYRLLILLVFVMSCDTGKLDFITDLPTALKEVSGTETTSNSDLIWMLNDGKNAPKLMGVNRQGKIIRALNINAKNHDWEDLTSDTHGNLYIGDFGNNSSSRKNLAVLKVLAKDLKNDSLVSVERITFSYPNQINFSPEKDQLYYDSEAFFHYNDSLYIFTKSRVKNNYGKTSLYKIPSKEGHYSATFVASFSTCPDADCWITSADISDDGQQVVLLTSKSAWLFTDFENDNFFSGTAKESSFDHTSQKEGVCFKNNHTLYITDEKSHSSGGNLYEFNLIR